MIGFSTEEGIGSTFYLFIPIEYDEDDKMSKNLSMLKEQVVHLSKTEKLNQKDLIYLTSEPFLYFNNYTFTPLLLKNVRFPSSFPSI